MTDTYFVKMYITLMTFNSYKAVVTHWHILVPLETRWVYTDLTWLWSKVYWVTMGHFELLPTLTS